MTLAKAFVTGVVIKAPEKRFTQNDFAIASFSLNIDLTNEIIIRVNTFGQLAENIASTVVQGDKVAVEGRLQVNSYKLPNGRDKKVFEIIAGAVEKMDASSTSTPQIASQKEENLVQFEENDTQDLIDEDEIPF